MPQSLIPLAQPADNQLTMSSREIAELTGKQHKDVIRDIRVMLDALQKDGADLRHVREDKDARGYTAMFHLNRELTDTLLTGYSIPLRRKVIARWHELEAKTTQPAFQIPATLSAALRLAAEQAEQIERQQQQLAIAAPKVEFVDRYVESTGNKCFRTVAKLLGAKEPALRAFLQYRGVMYLLDGEWMAYSQHHAAGRFVVKTGSRNGHSFAQTLFTPKGVQWIAGQWAKHQLPETETLF